MTTTKKTSAHKKSAIIFDLNAITRTASEAPTVDIKESRLRALCAILNDHLENTKHGHLFCVFNNAGGQHLSCLNKTLDNLKTKYGLDPSAQLALISAKNGLPVQKPLERNYPGNATKTTDFGYQVYTPDMPVTVSVCGNLDQYIFTKAGNYVEFTPSSQSFQRSLDKPIRNDQTHTKHNGAPKNEGPNS